MWTSKLGASGKTLLLGLTNEGELMDFGDVTTPVFRMRPRVQESGWVEFDVTEYTDDVNDPPLYNAQVEFDDWSGITEGVWVGEVIASVNGQVTAFPDDGYINLKFLSGVVIS
jgi:hypothetical protein